MTYTAHKQLRQFQKTLYKKAYAEAQAFSAMGSPTILKYAEQFHNTLPDTFTKIDAGELLKNMKASHFVLYGDFHTHRQSQKGLVRLLRAFMHKYPKKNIVLAVEMFKACDQPIIDQFTDGELSEESFLEQIKYSRDWGFPWKNYRLIIDFIRETQTPLIGINTPNAGKDSLETRDHYGAKILIDQNKKYRDRLVVCLIGEYHLADRHLPNSLGKMMNGRFNCLRILTNIDHIYFRNPPSLKPAGSEYFFLKKNLYCILNSPPWIKWQSYSIWEEMRSVENCEEVIFDEEISDPSKLHTEDSFDIDHQVQNILSELVRFLDIPVLKSELDRFNVYISPEQDTFDFLKMKYRLDQSTIAKAIEDTAINGFSFIPKGNAFVIEDITLNNLATACGQFLHSTRQSVNFKDKEIEFFNRVFFYGAGMVASMILNPRRKAASLDVLRLYLRKSQGKRLIGHARDKRTTYREVLFFYQWIEKKLAAKEYRLVRPPRSIFAKDEVLYFEISRTLGEMLGFMVYSKVITDRKFPGPIENFFQNLPTDKQKLKLLFTETYLSVENGAFDPFS